MPTITRWFKVTHDVNADPEMWELTDTFGDRAIRVWLEMLSIADRNRGAIGPDSDYTRIAIASKSRMSRTKVRLIFDWCLVKGWLVSDNGLKIAKWAKYNKTRDVDKIPPGKRSTSPPIQSYTVLDNTLIKKKRKIRVAPPSEAVKLAQLLSNEIFKNIPNRTPPSEAQLLTWAWEAEKINRIDGHPWDEIRELLLWSQHDDFWKTNILSMSKFRKQWNQLLAKKTQVRQGDKAAQIRQRTADILSRGLK